MNLLTTCSCRYLIIYYTLYYDHNTADLSVTPDSYNYISCYGLCLQNKIISVLIVTLLDRRCPDATECSTVGFRNSIKHVLS